MNEKRLHMERNDIKAKADELEIDYANNLPTPKLVDLIVAETGEDVSVYIEAKPEVKAELVEEYYESHPNRKTKLRGLLSRTTDRDERTSIKKMIAEL